MQTSIKKSIEKRQPEAPGNPALSQTVTGLIIYLLIGIFFGIGLTKSEVISWYRIQEMFHFQSFHMYGVIGTAVVAGAISVALIRRFKVKDFSGAEIVFPPKTKGVAQYLLGGSIFGMGWALTGACPGPMYSLIGSGLTVFAVAIGSALLGTLAYGALRDKLPH
jgi:uncharacterized membrane protein YedE/YeeE